jgi:OOP family OmpA-OmpF porin
MKGVGRGHAGLAVAAVIVAGTALTGCGGVFGAQAPDGDKCQWMAVSASEPAAVRTAILLDRSNSTKAATATELAPDYVKRLGDLVQSAIDESAVVSVGTFGGASTSLQWIVENQRTDRGRKNTSNRERDKEQARSCLTEHIRKAQAVSPQAPGSDVIGALAMAKLSMAGQPGDHKIILATDGLVTSGCADLTKAQVGVPALVDDIRAHCRASVGQSVDLSGTRVTLLGVGHPASRHPQPETTQVYWLNTLWQGLCTDLKATTCAVLSEPVSAPAGDGVLADPKSEEPVVAFPPPQQGLAGGGDTVFQLGSEVLFEPNSPVILPAGMASLNRIVGQIRAMPPVTVVVNGYTEGQADRAGNYALAKARADAVAGVLRGGGLAVTDAAGHDGTAPLCPEPAADAPRDDPARQCNRRVDIVVTEQR